MRSWTRFRTFSPVADLKSITKIAHGPAAVSGPVMNQVAFATNGIGMVIQGCNLKKEIDALHQMNRIKDTTGANLAGTRIASSSVYFSASIFSLSSLISNLTTSATPVSLFLGLIAAVLSGIGAVIGMSVSGYRLSELIKFRREMNQHFSEGTIQGLLFLKQKLAITQEEAAKICDEIETKHPDLSTAEKEKLFQEEYEKLAQVKLNAFKRLSSVKSAELIANQLDLLLEKLENPENDEELNEAIQEAMQLKQKTLSDNAKKTVLFTVLFVASALVLAGFVAATFFTAGLVPLLLETAAMAIGLMAVFTHWVATRIQKA